MIDKKISVSEQVANLPLAAQLIYTWGMPHADDLGLLPGSHRTLKAIIIPMVDMSISEFTKMIEAIISGGLWEEFEYKGIKYFHIKNFTRYQTLKKDRQPQTLLPVEHSSSPRETWASIEELGFQLEDTGIHLEPEEKRSKEKRREDNNMLDFEKFWGIYPKKVGKKKTKELWEKLSYETQLKILEDIPKRHTDSKWLGGFYKDPERYLKHEQWLDDISPPRGKVEIETRAIDSFTKK